MYIYYINTNINNIFLLYLFVLVKIVHVSSWKSKCLKNAYKSLKALATL